MTPDGQNPKPHDSAAYPERVVVGANGAYWRDFGTHYSMCPVSTDNDPVEPVAVFVRSDALERAVKAAVKTALASRKMPCFCGTQDAYRCPAHINPVQSTSGGR